MGGSDSQVDRTSSPFVIKLISHLFDRQDQRNPLAAQLLFRKLWRPSGVRIIWARNASCLREFNTLHDRIIGVYRDAGVSLLV